ncbi:MAG: nicotinate (nicotinamide) nucleotide adenylyltransferase [Candidatus Eisenbacteria bacterium]|nr:nicotinate (nicotinamide) nucleotide adenylyltransferase [Candidatus Eisenbacteria bacterium]
MRLGILGGSFDPPHLGHLVLADRCLDALRLDRVLFVPAYRPPHKIDHPLSPYDVRAAMVAAAIADVPEFTLCDLERRRAGISYTIDTLRELHAAHPGAELWLLLGEDSVEELEQWREPDQLTRLARIAAYRRPGCRGRVPERLRDAVRFVAGPRIDVSSTQLRALVAGGESVRFLVPQAVAEMMQRQRLYRA